MCRVSRFYQLRHQSDLGLAFGQVVVTALYPNVLTIRVANLKVVYNDEWCSKFHAYCTFLVVMAGHLNAELTGLVIAPPKLPSFDFLAHFTSSSLPFLELLMPKGQENNAKDASFYQPPC